MTIDEAMRKGAANATETLKLGTPGKKKTISEVLWIKQAD